MPKPVPPRMPPRAITSEQAAFIKSLEPVATPAAVAPPPNRPVDESTDRLGDESPDRHTYAAAENAGEERARETVTVLPKRGASKAPKRGGRALFARANGEAVRKLSFYFPPDVAKQLQMHCVENDRDMSTFVVDLVRRALARVPTRA